MALRRFGAAVRTVDVVGAITPGRRIGTHPAACYLSRWPKHSLIQTTLV